MKTGGKQKVHLDGKETLFCFQEATLRLREKWVFENTNWSVERGQNWGVLGANGSGKSTLMRALLGEVPVVAGCFSSTLTGRERELIGHVSLELHQELWHRDQALDEARAFSGQAEGGLTVGETVLADFPQTALRGEKIKELLSGLGIQRLHDSPMRFISNGEMRKLLLARALIKKPRLLILDEPFEGLDRQSRRDLVGKLTQLMRYGLQVVQTAQRVDDLLPLITNVLCVEDCQVVWQGPASSLPGAWKQSAQASSQDSLMPVRQVCRATGVEEALLDLQDVCISYGKHKVLKGINWTVRKGEHWALLGPNGCGKTTLLRLIFGEHPQGYANRVYLFGRRRGSGESLWEIKERVGFLSPELQVQYQKALPVLDVVLSGFFDTIGLYRRPSDEQTIAARKCLQHLGLDALSRRRFDLLSYGQKRMVLLARAVVKAPCLLVLDEPCQGLDLLNRRRLLSLVEKIALQQETQLIFVTHRREEMPRCINYVLELPASGLAARREPDREQEKKLDRQVSAC